jgi:hypothetical protein
METKLTLKLDKAIINSAKKYAQHKNKSLSKLVETYFKNLVSELEHGNVKYSPLVEELSGVISEKDLTALDYVEYLEGKYE